MLLWASQCSSRGHQPAEGCRELDPTLCGTAGIWVVDGESKKRKKEIKKYG